MKHKITASRLSNAMADCRISARELSDRSGVSESSVSQYVNGSHKPSNISAGKLAPILNVNPLWLMGFDVARETMNAIEAGFKDMSISNEERSLIEDFRKIDNRGKDLILNILHMEVTRVESEKTAYSAKQNEGK